jgi:hypothetical protein
MSRWGVTKREIISNEGETETTTYEADIVLDASDANDLPTLADIAALLTDLTTERGIPATARLGATINAPLRWTDADLA